MAGQQEVEQRRANQVGLNRAEANRTEDRKQMKGRTMVGKRTAYRQTVVQEWEASSTAQLAAELLLLLKVVAMVVETHSRLLQLSHHTRLQSSVNRFRSPIPLQSPLLARRCLWVDPLLLPAVLTGPLDQEAI